MWTRDPDSGERAAAGAEAAEPGVLIAGIVRRDGDDRHPRRQRRHLRAGDDVIVVTQDAALQELRDILRQG